MQISLKKREDNIVKAAKEEARTQAIHFDSGHDKLLREALNKMVEGLPPYLVEHLPKDVVLYVTGDPEDIGKCIVTEVKLTIGDVIYTVANGETDKQCYGVEIKHLEL